MRTLLALLVSILGCGRQAKQPPPETPVVTTTPAPDAKPTSCVGPPPAPDYVCVRDCTGPVVQAGDPEPGWSWLSPALAENRRKYGCPICLPADARIATPDGEIEISALRPGALVLDGARAPRRVEQVVFAIAPAHHQLVAVELADGRRLRASPGHPDADGAAVGGLAVGDVLDGSSVVRVVRVPYAGRTYDLVLEGGALTYYADGVRLGSSL